MIKDWIELRKKKQLKKKKFESKIINGIEEQQSAIHIQLSLQNEVHKFS